MPPEAARACQRAKRGKAGRNANRGCHAIQQARRLGRAAEARQEFVAAFVSADTASHRAPAVRQCSSPDEARHWVEREAAAPRPRTRGLTADTRRPGHARTKPAAGAVAAHQGGDRFGVIGGQNRHVPGASWAAIDGHLACAGQAWSLTDQSLRHGAGLPFQPRMHPRDVRAPPGDRGAAARGRRSGCWRGSRRRAGE